LHPRHRDEPGQWTGRGHPGGLSVLDAGLASVIVFAGAAQFLAAQMFLSGAGVIQIVVSGWLLNLRHLLMSSVVADHLDRRTSLPVRSVLAFGITDEVFGVAGRKAAAGEPIHPAFLAGLELGAYLAWVSGTVVGAVAGNVLPPSVRDAMGMALYALFAALLAGLIRDAAAGSRRRKMVFSALTAGGLNWLLRGVFGMDAGLAFPLAMVAAAVVFSGRDAGERTQ
jgi:predicted branched-subunit amino acid permease